MSNTTIAALLLACVLLQACSTLRPGYETPTVTITGVRTLPSQGVMPDFEIGLRVVNPNRQALNIDGISYTIELEGREVIKGVGNDFPVIEGYGQQTLSITASANLIEGIRLMSELLQSPKDRVRYEVKAKLDLGGFRLPIRIRDSGTLSLGVTGPT